MFPTKNMSTVNRYDALFFIRETSICLPKSKVPCPASLLEDLRSIYLAGLAAVKLMGNLRLAI